MARRDRSIVGFWAAALLWFFAAMPLVFVHSGTVSAAVFGSTANWDISGGCGSQHFFDSMGGDSISSTLAGTTTGGATTGCPDSIYPAGLWTGQTFAYANLATGQLKALAKGEGPGATVSLFPSGTPVNVNVHARSVFFDTFRLIPPSGFTDTSAVIAVHFTVTEQVSSDGPGELGSNQASLFWNLETNSVSTHDCDNSGAITPLAGFGCTFHKELVNAFLVPLSAPEVSIRATLSAVTFNNATADASGTGVLSFELPAGFTFESDSAVLLTQAVPEPETYALMLAGLGLLGFIARRRQRVS